MSHATETMIVTLLKLLGIGPELMHEQLKKIDDMRQITVNFKAQQDDMAARLVRIEQALCNQTGANSHDDAGTGNGSSRDAGQSTQGG